MNHTLILDQELEASHPKQTAFICQILSQTNTRCPFLTSACLQKYAFPGFCDIKSSWFSSRSVSIALTFLLNSHHAPANPRFTPNLVISHHYHACNPFLNYQLAPWISQRRAVWSLHSLLSLHSQLYVARMLLKKNESVQSLSSVKHSSDCPLQVEQNHSPNAYDISSNISHFLCYTFLCYPQHFLVFQPPMSPQISLDTGPLH